MAESERILYRIKGWEQHFESAKSKTYGVKQQTYMPNKHGLGYRRLLALPGGEALFGAWCSLCQLLSRQIKPRQGYLTDTGRLDGIPLVASDIALLTDFREETIIAMLANCSSPEIGWLERLSDVKDTTRIPQGYCNIPSGDSPLPLPLPLPSPSPSPPPIETTSAPTAAKPASEPEAKISWTIVGGFLNITDQDRQDWATAYPACTLDVQLAQMCEWLKANPAKAHKKQWRRFVTGWLSRSQEKGGDVKTHPPGEVEPKRDLAAEAGEIMARNRRAKDAPRPEGFPPRDEYSERKLAMLRSGLTQEEWEAKNASH